MVKVVGKTLVADKPFDFSLEPRMLERSLTHHFLEQRSKRRYPGSLDQTVLVNARSPDKDCTIGRDIEDNSRSDEQC